MRAFVHHRQYLTGVMSDRGARRLVPTLRQAPSTPATMSKQHCRTLQVDDSFDIVAKNGKNVEATFDRTKFYNRIVRHCCRLWQQSRILLRHCCWCGRGLTTVVCRARHATRRLITFTFYGSRRVYIRPTGPTS